MLASDHGHLEALSSKVLHLCWTKIWMLFLLLSFLSFFWVDLYRCLPPPIALDSMHIKQSPVECYQLRLTPSKLTKLFVEDVRDDLLDLDLLKALWYTGTARRDDTGIGAIGDSSDAVLHM